MNSKACASLFIFIGLLFGSAHVLPQNRCDIGDGTDTGGGSSSAGPWGNVSYILYESFENGTLDGAYPTGFKWGQAVRTTVVRDDQFIVWQKGEVLKGPTAGKDWAGYTGTHALRFRYPEGQNGWAEQRFSIGSAYPELWVGYWLRVPKDWVHGTGRDSNNKFFAIWMDEYEQQGPTGVIQTRNSNGDSVISPYVRTRANRHLGEDKGKLLIDIDRDRGRWMQVAIHMKMASSASRADGIFEMYRRWENEAEFEKIFGYDDWDNYHVGGNRGFAHGYLLGWANAIQSAESEWLMDDFILSEHSLLDAEPSTPDPGESDSVQTVPEIIVPLD